MSGYSQDSQQSKLAPDARDKLRNRLDDLIPLLNLESPFTINDVDRDVRDAIMLLKQNGAISSVDKERRNYRYKDQENQTTNTINVWTWNGGAKEWLQDELDQRDELPCGHRVHIFNSRDTDKLSCKHCPDDDKPEFDRDTVRDLL